MDKAQGAPARARYQARPGRSACVADNLAELRGPVSGTVKLPLPLFWSLPPDFEFDLSNPNRLRWLYENVLREASTQEHLTTYLNGPILVAVWPQLHLPRDVRRAWEERHPALRASVAA
jgi:hypothetical protein